jgi:hypothetical protein
MAREFPIANGKLVTDLDANGFKILNAQGGGGELPDLSDYAKKTDLDGYATKEQLNAVGNIAQGAADGVSFAIGEVNKLEQGFGAKRDKSDNIAAADSAEFTEWKFYCGAPEIQAALDATPPIIQPPTDPDADDYSPWKLVGIPTIEGYRFVRDVSDEMYDANAVSLTFSLVYISNTSGDPYDVTATREKMTVTKQGEPYVTPTGVGVLAIPKYEFVIGSLKQDEEHNYFVTLEPYHCTVLNGEDLTWPYFKVEAGGGSGKVRDCILVVDLTSMEDPPTITWGDNFHPRTDAETDFACVVGVRNIYWITEYAPNEFAVAGWQETTGGNAQ